MSPSMLIAMVVAVLIVVLLAGAGIATMESSGDSSAEGALVRGLSRKEREAKLAQLLEWYERKVIRFVDRFRIIEPHLDDYFSSLSSTAHQCVQDMRRYTALHLEHVNAMKQVMKDRRTSMYPAMIYQLTQLLKGLTGQSGVIVPEFQIRADWESRMELWLQQIGTELQKASTASEFKLSRHRARQPTSISLKVAGLMHDEE